MADDDYLDPDEIIDPDDRAHRRAGDGSFGFDDLDDLARRAVDTVLHLVRRANALAGAVLLFAVIAGVGGFLLGVAALSEGMQTVWIVLGGFFAIVAIGSVLLAMWRLRSVRTGADHLVSEVKSLIGGNSEHERVVIQTVQTNEASSDSGVVELSRGFFDMRSMVSGRVGDVKHLASAITAVTTFPGLVALATLISFVFLGLSLIFLIALAL